MLSLYTLPLYFIYYNLLDRSCIKNMSLCASSIFIDRFLDSGFLMQFSKVEAFNILKQCIIFAKFHNFYLSGLCCDSLVLHFANAY